MEQKTLDMPDGLKEENEQEITSNEKCYGSDSGDNPARKVRHPIVFLPTCINR
jgi:hypothetical protein